MKTGEVPAKEDASSKRPSAKMELAYLIAKHGVRIAWFTGVAGYIWILLFPLVTITTGEVKTRGTYFEENALLPTLMTSSLGATAVRQASHLFEEGQEAIAKGGSKGYDEWMCGVMEGMGDGAMRCQAHDGIVWGMLGPPKRSEGQEAVLLVAFRDELRNAQGGAKAQEGEEGVVSGASLALVLMQELGGKSWPWLHKNIVLLIAPGGEGQQDREWAHLPKLKEWCNGYLDGRRPYASPYAGSLRAAILIDLPSNGTSPRFASFRVLTSGSRGQQPNLDLTHLATLFLASTTTPSAPVDVDMDWHASKLSPYGLGASPLLSLPLPKWLPRWALGYVHRLRCMAGFMLTSAGGASGGHAFFLRRGVDSLTIQAVPSDSPDPIVSPARGRRRGADATQLLQALHKTVRSLNNLEARLYHGFFLYLMPSVSHFVSLSEYVYSLVLLSLPCLPFALALSAAAASTHGWFWAGVDAALLLLVAEGYGIAALVGLRMMPSAATELLSWPVDQELKDLLTQNEEAGVAELSVFWVALCLPLAGMSLCLTRSVGTRGRPGTPASWRTPAAVACYMMLFGLLALAFLSYSLAVLLSLPVVSILLSFFPLPRLPAVPQVIHVAGKEAVRADNPEPQAEAPLPETLSGFSRLRVALGILAAAAVLLGPGLAVFAGTGARDNGISLDTWWQSWAWQAWPQLLGRYVLSHGRYLDDVHVPVYCLLVFPVTVLLCEALIRWVKCSQ